jgi:hypothetical protein
MGRSFRGNRGNIRGSTIGRWTGWLCGRNPRNRRSCLRHDNSWRPSFLGAASTAPLVLQVEVWGENDASLHAKQAILPVTMDFDTFEEQESARLLLGTRLLVSSAQLQRASRCVGEDHFGAVSRRSDVILIHEKRQHLAFGSTAMMVSAVFMSRCVRVFSTFTYLNNDGTLCCSYSMAFCHGAEQEQRHRNVRAKLDHANWKIV